MKYLKVGAHKYQLIVAANDSGDCGETDSIKGTITVNTDMPQSMKEATLIHELFHACNTTLGEDHNSHALIDSLADQLYAVLKENGLINEAAMLDLLV